MKTLQFRNYRGEMTDAPKDHKNVLTSLYDGLIVWSKSGKRHSVRYGLELKPFTGENADVEAAKCFGLAVRHNLECDGKLGYNHQPINEYEKHNNTSIH